MIPRLIPLTLAACCLAAIGCRHHQAPTPAVTPMASAKATPPEVRVTPPTRDFVAPVQAADDFGEPSRATELAEERGLLRDAFFDFDAATLRPDARANLAHSAEWLKAHPEFNLLIEGHCDERGTEQYNLALGERRAWEAKNYLGILGYDTRRVRTISYGKDRPFDSGHDETAWATNRRAHLVLTASK